MHRGQDRTGHRETGTDQERPVEALGERDDVVVHAGVEQALGAAVGDGREDRQTERAADLLRGVDQPGRQPGLVRLGAGRPRRS